MLASAQDDLRAREEGYWWHVGRRAIIERWMERAFGPTGSLDILDVGCGSGRNLQLLDRWGRARGVEPSGPGLDACRAAGLGSDRVMQGGADRLPVPDSSFDLVTAFDVLEHLDDDAAGLAEARRVLRPAGHLLVTVPAYRFLWSVHDEALGHRRRYVASELHSALNRAGFVVVHRSYAISAPLPAILAYRVAQGLRPSGGERGASYVDVPPWAHHLLVGALKLEARWMQHLSLPIGASIVALARKGLPAGGAPAHAAEAEGGRRPGYDSA